MSLALIQSQQSVGSTEIETLIGEDRETTNFFEENPLCMIQQGTHQAACDKIFQRMRYRPTLLAHRGDRKYPLLTRLDAEYREAKAHYLQRLKIAIARDRQTITHLRGQHAYTSQALNALAILVLCASGYGIGALLPPLATVVITDQAFLAGAASACFANPGGAGCMVIQGNALNQTWIGPVLNAYAGRFAGTISGALAGLFATPGGRLLDRHVNYEGSHHRRKWLLKVEKLEAKRINNMKLILNTRIEELSTKKRHQGERNTLIEFRKKIRRLYD